MAQLIDIAKVSEADEASQWLIVHATPGSLDWEVLRRVARQAAQQGDQPMLKKIVTLVHDSEPWQQLTVLREFTQSAQETGSSLADNPIAVAWAERLVTHLSPELTQPGSLDLRSLDRERFANQSVCPTGSKQSGRHVGRVSR